MLSRVSSKGNGYLYDDHNNVGANTEAADEGRVAWGGDEGVGGQQPSAEEEARRTSGTRSRKGHLSFAFLTV